MKTIITENFTSPSQHKLCQLALKALWKNFPGFNWGADGGYEGLIRITEAKLLEWGGDIQCMTVHARDWDNLIDFEKLCVKLGGELLERANQSTRKNDGSAVTKLPDGFNRRFVRNYKPEKRIKMVGPKGESLEEMRRIMANRHQNENWAVDPTKPTSRILIK